MNIAVDFDGTCVTHEFPNTGRDIGAAPILKRLVEAGHNLILFTMRGDMATVESTDSTIKPIAGNYLSNALKWFKSNDIELYGINTNPTQHKWTSSPKAFAHLYIDDSGLGIPLRFDPKISQRPFVDWIMVETMLINLKLI